MSDTVRSEDDFLNPSTGLFKDNTSGDISAQDLRDFVKSSMVSQISLFTGRLTLESGVYVSSSDQTGKTSLYLCGPENGNVMTWLYDGTSWKYHTFSQLTLATPSLTASTPYDVWLYSNSGTPTLEVLAWTNATTRATALSTQDGVVVKSGAATRRYVGTIYPSATDTMEDSKAKRFVWNYYNIVQRRLWVNDNTEHTYTTTSWRQYRNQAANQVDMVVGMPTAMTIDLGINLYNSNYGYVAIFAMDSVTTLMESGVGGATFANPGISDIRGSVGVSVLVPIGRHYIAAAQHGNSPSTTYSTMSLSGLLAC